MKSLIQQYTEIEELIYEHIGYEGSWKVFPIDDCTEMYWLLDSRSVRFADNKESLIDTEEKDYYKDDFYYRQQDNVYVGKDWTGITVDTHADGNSYLRIFDNTRQVTLKEIEEATEEKEQFPDWEVGDILSLDSDMDVNPGKIQVEILRVDNYGDRTAATYLFCLPEVEREPYTRWPKNDCDLQDSTGTNTPYFRNWKKIN